MVVVALQSARVAAVCRRDSWDAGLRPCRLAHLVGVAGQWVEPQTLCCAAGNAACTRRDERSEEQSMSHDSTDTGLRRRQMFGSLGKAAAVAAAAPVVQTAIISCAMAADE